jgi:hypothetical protein
MKPKSNYNTLSDKLFALYDKIEEGRIDVNKAKAMVRAATTINSIHRAKLIATQTTSQEKRVIFYED